MPRTSAAATFVFDRDYDNREQVRPYMGDYMRIFRELEAAGKYPYNSAFKGRIPGIIGPSEDTAIYMLQNLRELDALDEKVRDFLASGGRHVEELDETLRGTVVCYGFYVGGTGWTQYEESRLLSRNGRPYAILPKGKRTHGHFVQGQVLYRP